MHIHKFPQHENHVHSYMWSMNTMPIHICEVWILCPFIYVKYEYYVHSYMWSMNTMPIHICEVWILCPFIYVKYEYYAHSYVIQLLMTHSYIRQRSKVSTHRSIVHLIIFNYNYRRFALDNKEAEWYCRNITHWYFIT
jgi:hypothetical protein